MIERKNKTHTKRIVEKAKEGYSKAKKNFDNSKNPSSSKRSDLFCDHYKIARHIREMCWKVYLEFFLKKLKKNYQSRLTMALMVDEDFIEHMLVDRADLGDGEAKDYRLEYVPRSKGSRRVLYTKNPCEARSH